LDGVTEQLVIDSEKAGAGWGREFRDAWHNMGVEPGTNRKYTNLDGREAVFTTSADGLSVHVTDYNGPTYNYGRNDFTHTCSEPHYRRTISQFTRHNIGHSYDSFPTL
jgi:hypothetical protein